MNSFLAYLGGKSLLSRRIIQRIPEHKCYCEVFAGAAWVLFRKEESEVEIINDINSELVTLYRVIKLHLDEFIRYFRWILAAREEFERFKKEQPETLTDVQKAVQFYYLMKLGYASKIPNPTFGLSPTQPPRLNLLRIEEELSAVHLRLSRVYVENLRYGRMIERADRPSTFFYLDPPYYGYEDAYGKGLFSKDDFEALGVILKGIRGKFMLSINDIPEIREVFKSFYIEEVNTSYTASGANRRKHVTELLISNYETNQGGMGLT